MMRLMRFGENTVIPTMSSPAPLAPARSSRNGVPARNSTRLIISDSTIEVPTSPCIRTRTMTAPANIRYGTSSLGLSSSFSLRVS